MATKRNAIGVLMGVELVLNGANINFVAFAHYNPAFRGRGADLRPVRHRPGGGRGGGRPGHRAQLLQQPHDRGRRYGRGAERIVMATASTSANIPGCSSSRPRCCRWRRSCSCLLAGAFGAAARPFRDTGWRRRALQRCSAATGRPGRRLRRHGGHRPGLRPEPRSASSALHPQRAHEHRSIQAAAHAQADSATRRTADDGRRRHGSGTPELEQLIAGAGSVTWREPARPGQRSRQATVLQLGYRIDSLTRHHVPDGDVHRHADPPLLDRLHERRAAAESSRTTRSTPRTAICTAAAASAASSCSCRCSASRCSTWSWRTTSSRCS